MPDQYGAAGSTRESKHAEERDPETLQSEHFYKALIESSQDSIKILDLEGNLLSMNPGGRHLMEIDDLRKWLGKPWIEFWAGEHRESVRQALAAARSGESGRFEAFRTTTKGKPKWWDVVVTPVKDASGRPRQLLAIARDITDRKRAEDAVRFEAEASFAVTESLDFETTMSNIASALVPELADSCTVDLVQEDGTIRAAALKHRDPEKQKVLEEIRNKVARRVADENGPAAVLRNGEPILMSDVTDEYIRNAAPDEKLRALIQSLDLQSFAAVPMKARGRILGVLTVATTRDGRVYSQEDLPLLLELGRISGLATENAHLYRAANTEVAERRRAEAELRELNETLEERIAERTRALENANEVLKSEIADRHRAELELEAANRQLTSRNRELQEFAYAASHDLQEPLRKISSFVDLIREDFNEVLPELGREYLDRIQHASIRMSQLIHDLLLYSRVETRQRPTSDVDLYRIVQEILVDLEVPISETEAEIDVRELPTVNADPLQMRQLFQNLVSNALKFSKEEDKPRICISAVRESDEPSSSRWRISVQDNGIGFDQTYADRIFSPFQRLHERGRYPGTGMGLAICRRIVERHDGQIWAKSNPGEGATFEFTLPDAAEDLD